MTTEEFEKHRQSLLQRLSEAPKNLSEQTAYLWDSIGKGYGDFDIKEQLTVALKALTFDQWKQFFSRQIMEGKRHALWIDTQGKFVDQQLHNTVPLGDSVASKAEMNYYSFD
jgi:secreted Zn-dependent insulinase-like peptidase